MLDDKDHWRAGVIADTMERYVSIVGQPTDKPRFLDQNMFWHGPDEFRIIVAALRAYTNAEKAATREGGGQV